MILTIYDECPMGKDLEPGCPHCKKCENFISSEVDEYSSISPNHVKVNCKIRHYPLTTMVKDNKKSYFQYYRDGSLWYKTECGFEYPVPVSDIGIATYNYIMKSISMMIYIRKQIKFWQDCKDKINKGV